MKRSLVVLGAFALALPALGSCAMTRSHGFDDDRETIQVVSAVVGGKNVFVPGTIVLGSGRPRRLSIWNGTETVHGFAIADLGIEVVLQPQAEFELELPALEAHAVHEIHCHLHGAHRRAAIVVVPGR